MSNTPKENKTLYAVIKEYALLLIPVLLISFLLQYFVIATFKVNGDSMTPTLQNGQTMMMYKLGTPSRFDVIVIEAPDGAYEYDQNTGQIKTDIFGNQVRKLYIKRVIGMPGDTLEYKNDTLYINGIKYDEPYLEKSRQQYNGQYMADSTLEEYMVNARRVIPSLPAENTQLAEKDGVKVIPEGYYFVMGDNRLYSKDSQEYGLVNQQLIKGIAVIRLFPLDKIGIAPFND